MDALILLLVLDIWRKVHRDVPALERHLSMASNLGLATLLWWWTR